MRPFKAITFAASVIWGGTSASFAQTSPDQDRTLIARDVCIGVGARFASGGNISYQAERFRVEQGRGSVTVFEGAVKITEIPGFTYTNYTNCLESVFSHFEKTRAVADSKNGPEIFSAVYELNTFLHIGICMSSAAKGGGSFIQIEPGRESLEEFFGKYSAAVSTSVSRRVKRYSGRDIALGIAGRMQYYRYQPGRAVPYFERDSIQAANDAVQNVTSSQYDDYIRIARIAARMRQTFMYALGVSGGLDRARAYGEQLKLSHYPAALDCLNGFYRNDSRNLREVAADLGINSPSVPTFETALSIGQAVARGQMRADRMFAQSFFEERVTATIRSAIRTSN